METAMRERGQDTQAVRGGLTGTEFDETTEALFLTSGYVYGSASEAEAAFTGDNLGDSKSLVTHPASTTHRRLKPDVRAAMGITDGIIRISVGLEDQDDIIGDVLQALGNKTGSARNTIPEPTGEPVRPGGPAI